MGSERSADPGERPAVQHKDVPGSGPHQVERQEPACGPGRRDCVPGRDLPSHPPQARPDRRVAPESELARQGLAVTRPGRRPRIHQRSVRRWNTPSLALDWEKRETKSTEARARSDPAGPRGVRLSAGSLEDLLGRAVPAAVGRQAHAAAPPEAAALSGKRESGSVPASYHPGGPLSRRRGLTGASVRAMRGAPSRRTCFPLAPRLSRAGPLAAAALPAGASWPGCVRSMPG